jgi:hypothetical protein
MSLKWTISHADRLVEATFAGALQPGEVERYLAEVAAAGGMPYRKIIDLTFAPSEVPLVELKAMIRCVEQYAKIYTLGPIAIVVDCDWSEDASALFGQRTNGARPFRIFRKMPEAMAWLSIRNAEPDAVMMQASP